ncbi:hypothetical protein AB0399_12940 [Streptomyces sp. NPDC088194]|uniref:hypothetical protein n=1 Tax=Streptomyces sp. NPDC088194 TaxID=3154931 RepID=UPI00344F3AA5
MDLSGEMAVSTVTVRQDVREPRRKRADHPGTRRRHVAGRGPGARTEDLRRPAPRRRTRARTSDWWSRRAATTTRPSPSCVPRTTTSASKMAPGSPRSSTGT